MHVTDEATWSTLKSETDTRISGTVEYAEMLADRIEQIMSEGIGMPKAILLAHNEIPYNPTIIGMKDSAALILRDCWQHGESFFKEYARATGQAKIAGKIRRQEKQSQSKNAKEKK